MLRVIAAAFAAMLFLVAPSEPPTTSGGEQGQEPKNEPAAKQSPATPNARGTESAPFVIKIVPEVQGPSEHRTSESDQKPPAKWLPIGDWTGDNYLAVFTGMLVLVGVLQLLVFKNQAYWLRHTVESSEAATKVLERAYITGGGGRIEGDLFDLHIGNYGRTPADLIFIEYGFISSTTPLPVARTASDVIYSVRAPFRDSIAPGSHKSLPSIAIDPNTVVNTVIYGRFHYVGIWKDRHSSGFLLNIDAVGGGIPIEADADHEGYHAWD